MDNIVDLEIEKLKAIINKVENDPESDITKITELNLWKEILKRTEIGRRTGISLVGHGDALAMLGMKYDSAEAKDFLVELHRLQATITYRSSEELGKKRGFFKCYDADLEEDNPFLERVDAKNPRRNIALLTIPPFGTGSLIFNNQTNGIEPVFMVAYERRVKAKDGEQFDFVDKVGDKWRTYKVFHPHFKMWADINGISEEELTKNTEKYIALSPYAGSASHEIDPIKKVELQGAIQKYVDHSISVTHNLPKDVTNEEILNIYMTAWKSGCKGCTIYVDGSRAGVLNSGSEEEVKAFVRHDAPERPKDLLCDIYHPTIRGEQYVVLVGLYDDNPYEVFAYKGTISKNVKKGILSKQKRGVYNLLDEESNVLINNIAHLFETPYWEDITRLISTALRHGAAIDYIVEQLNKSKAAEDVTAISKAIARQLKRYLTIKDDGVVTPCPDCGQDMSVEGGCKQCKHCGYGSCG